MCRHYQIESDEFTSLKSVSGYSDIILKQKDIKVLNKAPIIMAIDRKPYLREMGFGFTLYDKPVYNARIETVSERPLFADLFKKQRCLIPITAFFEDDEFHVEHRFKAKEKLFYLLGLYSHNEFVILTKKPNEEVAYYHYRMPFAINQDEASFYLDETKTLLDIGTLKSPDIKADDSSTQLSLF